MDDRSKNKPKNSIVITGTVQRSRLDPVRIIAERCGSGHHRWAYLEGGGQACGYCGARRR